MSELKIKVFLIISFDVEFDELCDFIKDLFEKDGAFDVFRADDLLNQENILKEIVLSIHESDLIIADLTGLNPNVFYELGLAHALEKNVILLTQDIAELPFDLRSYRVIQYSTHFAKIKDFEKTLLQIMQEVKDGAITFGNPVTDWLPTSNRYIASKGKRSDKEVDEPSTVSQPGSKEESGFLDHLVDLQESLQELTILINEFSSKTGNLTDYLSKKSGEIKSAWQSSSAGTASHVRKLARKIAASMNDYGSYTADLNKNYERLWSTFVSSTTEITRSDLITASAENVEGFREFLEGLQTMKDQLIPARDQFESTAESVTALRGFQREVNRASDIVEREIKILAGHLDKSISALDRILDLGSSRLGETE